MFSIVSCWRSDFGCDTGDVLVRDRIGVKILEIIALFVRLKRFFWKVLIELEIVREDAAIE